MAQNYAAIAALGEPAVTCPNNSVNRLSLDTALLAYDTLITLPHEVEYIWPKKIRLGTMLYLMARYPLLVVLALNVIPSESLQVCFLSIYECIW